MSQAEYCELCQRLCTEFVLKQAEDAKVVWARLKGYPTWPAQVLSAAAASSRLGAVKQPKEDALPVMFFKDYTVAWVPKKHTMSWSQGMYSGLFAPKAVHGALREAYAMLCWEKRVAPPGWWCKPPPLDAQAAAQARVAPLPPLPPLSKPPGKKGRKKAQPVVLARAAEQPTRTGGAASVKGRAAQRAGQAGGAELGGQGPKRQGAALQGQPGTGAGGDGGVEKLGRQAGEAAGKAKEEQGAAGGAGDSSEAARMLAAAAIASALTAAGEPAAAASLLGSIPSAGTAGGDGGHALNTSGGGSKSKGPPVLEDFESLGNGLSLASQPAAVRRASIGVGEPDAAHAGRGEVVLAGQEDMDVEVTVEQCAAGAARDVPGSPPALSCSPLLGCAKCRFATHGCVRCRKWAAQGWKPLSPTGAGRGEGKHAAGKGQAAVGGRLASPPSSPSPAKKARRSVQGNPAAGAAPQGARPSRHEQQAGSEAGPAPALPSCPKKGGVLERVAGAAPLSKAGLQEGVGGTAAAAAALPPSCREAAGGAAESGGQTAAVQRAQGGRSKAALDAARRRSAPSGVHGRPEVRAPRQMQLTLRDTLRSVINKLKMVVPALRGPETPNDTPSLVQAVEELFGEALTPQEQRGRTWQDSLATLFSWAKGCEVEAHQVDACFPVVMASRAPVVKPDQQALEALGLNLHLWQLPLTLRQVRSVAAAGPAAGGAAGAAAASPRPSLPPSLDKSSLAWEACSKGPCCVKPAGHVGWCTLTAAAAAKWLAGDRSDASSCAAGAAGGAAAGEQAQHAARDQSQHAKRPRRASAPSAAALASVDGDDADLAGQDEWTGGLKKAKVPRASPVAALHGVQPQKGAAGPSTCVLSQHCPKPAGHLGFCIQTKEGAKAYRAAAGSKAHSAASAAAPGAAHEALLAAPQRPRSAAPVEPLDPALQALKNRKPQYVHIKQNVWVSKPRPKRLPRDEIPVCNCHVGRLRVARSARQLVMATLARQPSSSPSLSGEAPPSCPPQDRPAVQTPDEGASSTPAGQAAAQLLSPPVGHPAVSTSASWGHLGAESGQPDTDDADARLAAARLAAAAFAPFQDRDRQLAKQLVARALRAVVAAEQFAAGAAAAAAAAVAEEAARAAAAAAEPQRVPGDLAGAQQLGGGKGTRRGAAARGGAARAQQGADQPEVEDADLPPRDGCGEGCLNRLSFIHCDVRTCPCGDRCANRPFLAQPRPDMEVFLTQDKGWGVRATGSITRGTFIVEYAGEVIDDRECQLRAEDAKRRNEPHFYMMEMAPGLIIDARVKGNVARLLNSSCDPNCETQKWRDAGNGETRVGIFALRDIAPGEELTYDYHFQHFGLAAAAGAYKCTCGAANCRGTMDTAPDRTKDYARRIQVWWPADQEWYSGTVTGYSSGTGRHTIKYDDGEVERVNLATERYRWVDEAGQPMAEIQQPAREAAQGQKRSKGTTRDQPGKRARRPPSSARAKPAPPPLDPQSSAMAPAEAAPAQHAQQDQGAQPKEEAMPDAQPLPRSEAPLAELLMNPAPASHAAQPKGGPRRTAREAKLGAQHAQGVQADEAAVKEEDPEGAVGHEHQATGDGCPPAGPLQLPPCTHPASCAPVAASVAAKPQSSLSLSPAHALLSLPLEAQTQLMVRAVQMNAQLAQQAQQQQLPLPSPQLLQQLCSQVPPQMLQHLQAQMQVQMQAWVLAAQQAQQTATAAAVVATGAAPAPTPACVPELCHPPPPEASQEEGQAAQQAAQLQAGSVRCAGAEAGAGAAPAVVLHAEQQQDPGGEALPQCTADPASGVQTTTAAEEAAAVAARVAREAIAAALAPAAAAEATGGYQQGPMHAPSADGSSAAGPQQAQQPPAREGRASSGSQHHEQQAPMGENRAPEGAADVDADMDAADRLHGSAVDSQLMALSGALEAVAGPDPQVDNPGAEAVAGRLHGNGKGSPMPVGASSGHRAGMSRGAGGFRRGVLSGGGAGEGRQGGTRSRRTIRPPSHRYGDDFEDPQDLVQHSDGSEEDEQQDDHVSEEEYKTEEEEEEEDPPLSPPRRPNPEARLRAAVAASMSPASQAAATIAALSGVDAKPGAASLHAAVAARQAGASRAAGAAAMITRRSPLAPSVAAVPALAQASGHQGASAGGAAKPGRRHPTAPSTGLPARTILVAKKLTNSDVTKGRILLPRAAVEANLSFAIGRAHSLAAQDHKGRGWEFTLQSWANGMESRRVYVLEHAGEFVRSHALKTEDVIGISTTEDGTFLIEYNTDEVCNAAETQAAARPGQGGHSPLIPGAHGGAAGLAGRGHNPLISQNAGRCSRSEYCNKPAGHPGFCTRTPAGAAAASSGRARRAAEPRALSAAQQQGAAPGAGPPPGVKRLHRLLHHGPVGAAAAALREAGRPKRARKLTEKAAAMGEGQDEGGGVQQEEEDSESGYETPTHSGRASLPPGSSAAAHDAAAVPPIFVMAPSDSHASPAGPLRRIPSPSKLLPSQAAAAALVPPGVGMLAQQGLGAAGTSLSITGMGKLLPSPVPAPMLSPLPALNGSAPIPPNMFAHHALQQGGAVGAPSAASLRPAASHPSGQPALDVADFLAGSSPHAPLDASQHGQHAQLHADPQASLLPSYAGLQASSHLGLALPAPVVPPTLPAPGQHPYPPAHPQPGQGAAEQPAGAAASVQGAVLSVAPLSVPGGEVAAGAEQAQHAQQYEEAAAAQYGGGQEYAQQYLLGEDGQYYAQGPDGEWYIIAADGQWYPAEGYYQAHYAGGEEDQDASQEDQPYPDQQYDSAAYTPGALPLQQPHGTQPGGAQHGLSQQQQVVAAAVAAEPAAAPPPAADAATAELDPPKDAPPVLPSAHELPPSQPRQPGVAGKAGCAGPPDNPSSHATPGAGGGEGAGQVGGAASAQPPPHWSAPPPPAESDKRGAREGEGKRLAAVPKEGGSEGDGAAGGAGALVEGEGKGGVTEGDDGTEEGGVPRADVQQALQAKQGGILAGEEEGGGRRAAAARGRAAGRPSEFDVMDWLGGGAS